MHVRNKLAKAAIAVAGVSFASMVIAGASGAANISWQDDDKMVVKEEKDKKSKRTVRVIQSGKPSIVVGSTSPHIEHKADKDVEHRGTRSYSFTIHDDKHDKAVEKIKKSLKKVKAQLKKAKTKSAKESLEMAEEALKTSLKALQQSRAAQVHSFAFSGDHRERLADALKDVEIYQGDIQSMRVEVLDELGSVREALRQALGDVELEIDLDGELRSLRIDSIRRAEDRLEGMEEEHLEALRRAEEDLRRAREKLQKRMAEKQAEEDEDN